MNEKMWEAVKDFHGHQCPGLAIGYKVCEALFDLYPFLVSRAKDEELVCICENDSCAVDAIQVLTGCTFGKGNFLYEPNGKHVYSFYLRERGESVRFYVNIEDCKRETKAETLEVVMNTPFSEIVSKGEVKKDFPAYARIFNSIKCSNCGEYVAEGFLVESENGLVCKECK